MTEIWRFIDSGPNTGAFNMAMDESMALAAEQDDFQPTLRFFCWRPYTISLGFHQRQEDINIDKCRQAGIGLVRRPTGGRAILHAEEITYSVVLPANSRFYSEQILPSYKTISNALVAGLMLLSPAIRFEQTDKALKTNYTKGFDNLPCFSSSIQYEISANGKKLVGSAQRRFKNALLQHGAILIGPEHLNLVDYFTDSADQKKLKEYLAKRTTCLNELANRNISYAEAVAAIRKGFEMNLNIQLIPGQFSRQEHLTCEKLLATYTIE